MASQRQATADRHLYLSTFLICLPIIAIGGFLCGPWFAKCELEGGTVPVGGLPANIVAERLAQGIDDFPIDLLDQGLAPACGCSCETRRRKLESG
jgi:hypothetical protein